MKYKVYPNHLKLASYLLILAGIIQFSSCNPHAKKTNFESNRELARRYHQIWSNGHVSELDNILDTSFVCHFINNVEWKGIEGVRSTIIRLRKSFPDWNEEIVDIICEGDKVVTRFRSTGTQQAKFHDIDSTGREIEIYETAIYRIANDKITEQWGFPDAIGLQNQLEGNN